jgi:dihydroneopterin aldolase/D-erythro-7,8-dihydroneopterin triphosphate epimerase
MALDIDRLDRIHIRDLHLRCIIGIYDEERRDKQDLLMNIVMYTDLSEAGKTDRIEDTVDYKSIKKNIIAMVEKSECLLIEHLAQKIADICLSDPRVRRAVVTVDKPGALRFARSVAVEIVRDRPADE